MTVGELFVDLKIVGGNAAASQIQMTGKALHEVKKMAIETKAAILAAIVATERLLTGPLAEGAGYAKFERLTGISAEYLQRVQTSLAKQQVSFEQSQGFIEDLNNKVAQMKVVGPTLPGLREIEAEMSKVGKTIGDITELDAPKLAEFLREFATLPENIIGRQKKLVTAQAFGISPEILQGLMGTTASFQSTAVDSMISSAQAKGLERSAVGLQKVERQMKRMAADFVSKYGSSITEGLFKIIKAVEMLASGLVRAAEALKVFDAIGATFKTVSGFVSETAKAFEKIDIIGDKLSKDPKKLDVFKNIKNIAPSVKPSASTEKHGSVLNQTVNIQGGIEDAQKVADTVTKETRVAYRMLAAQVQKV